MQEFGNRLKEAVDASDDDDEGGWGPGGGRIERGRERVMEGERAETRRGGTVAWEPGLQTRRDLFAMGP